MKIAHLAKHLNSGGIPIYIYTLGKVLRSQGVEQIVISSGGEMETDFVESGMSCYAFDLNTKFAFHPKIFAALIPVVRVLQKEKVDLIHAHTRVGQIMGALIERITGIPLVSTSHGFFKPRLGRKFFPAWGHKVIAISEAVRQDLIKAHHVPENKTRTVTNGIEIERFQKASLPEIKARAKNRFMIQPSDFAICMVTRLVMEKGAEDLLKAVQILIKKHSHLRVFIVGDGKDREYLERKASELGVSGAVTFTGNLSDVTEVLAACDAFIHPGRVLEGFGLSIVEAMAAALPVIVTEPWALWDLFLDKNIGARISVECPDEIAAMLEKWIANPEQTVQMGKNAQAQALKQFNIQKMASDVVCVYREVLAETGR